MFQYFYHTPLNLHIIVILIVDCTWLMVENGEAFRWLADPLKFHVFYLMAAFAHFACICSVSCVIVEKVLGGATTKHHLPVTFHHTYTMLGRWCADMVAMAPSRTFL